MQRRQFLAAGFSSITGSLLLSQHAKAELSENVAQLTQTLSDNNRHTDSQAFWQNVKHQFPLQPELYYFNNASLV